MTTHSASAAHGTTRPAQSHSQPMPEERRTKRWENIRLITGSIALILVAAGVLALPVIATADPQMSSRTVALIVACGVAIVSGGQLARACFGSQRAADREAAFMARIDADDNRLDELFGEVAEMRNTVNEALRGLAAYREHLDRVADVLEQFMKHEIEGDRKLIANLTEKVVGIEEDVAALVLDRQPQSNVTPLRRLPGEGKIE